MARTIHSLQFKQEAVAMAKASGASVRGTAKSLGLRPETLQYWIDHPPGVAQRCNGKRAGQDLESDDPAALKLRLKEAEARIRRLEMERDILKKAVACFANPSP
jgi:transposase-like protein